MADRDDDGEGQAKRGGSSSSFQLWFEEAWEGWIRPLGVIFLLIVAVAIYKFDLITESFAGVLLAAGVIGGTLASGALPAWPLVRKPGERVAFFAMVALWLLGTGYPSLRVAIPGHVLAEGHLTTEAPSATLKTGAEGPYALTVSGHFKQAGAADAEATYTIKAEAGGATDEVSDKLERKRVSVRVGRRGGTSTQLQEHTEQSHRLPTVRGGEVKLTADGVDDQLEEGLAVALRSGGPNPLVFTAMAVLALLLALGLDAKLVDPSTLTGKSKSKGVRTYLTAAVGVALVFSLDYPAEATPHSVVRPAVGALALGLLAGGIGGWLLSTIARGLFGPKVKKANK
jgi:hypothetical protein